MGQADATTGSSAPPVNLDLRIRLSVMMFLQFAIWGAWFVVLGNYLTAMGHADWIGRMFGTMALGAVITPMVFGQIADRYFSSERLMAILHLVGAGLLFWMAQVQEPVLLYAVALTYALIYTPTLTLSNSIAFSHLPNATRDFPGIRVLGTIGWIAAGMSVDYVLGLFTKDVQQTNRPLLLASGLSLILGGFSFFLPHTPPKGKAGDALPFLRALGLLKNPSFAVFFGVSFVITIVLAFYYGYTGTYLELAHGVKRVASTMSIGQWAEMLLLPLLPFFLLRFGMKWVLAIGMFAWGLRYGIFAIGEPYWLVIASLALHGICFDFFFAAGFIHVDNEAPKDIRASGQALFGFLTYGLGMWIGNELSGYIYQQCAVSKVVNWAAFWLFPCVGVFLSLAVFILFFQMQKRPAADGPAKD